jgi:hypothetical protein
MFHRENSLVRDTKSGGQGEMNNVGTSVYVKKKTAPLTNILSFLILLTVLQQFFLESSNIYHYIRMVLYVCFGFLAMLSFVSILRFQIHGFVRTYIIAVVSTLTLLTPLLLFKQDGFNAVFFEQAIPLGVLLCSYTTEYSQEQHEKLLARYTALSAFLGLFVVFFYGQGFKVTPIYFFRSKNQIGPFLGLSFITLVYRLILGEPVRFTRIRFLDCLVGSALTITIIASMLALRNRAGLLAMIIISCTLVFRKFLSRLTLKAAIWISFFIVILTITLSLGLIDNLIGMVWDAFTLNYNVFDLNSLSAGRWRVYEESIAFIIDNPLFGEITSSTRLNGTAHNYVLNKLVKLGFVGSFPLLVFYLYLWFFVFKGLSSRTDVVSRGSKLGLLVLLLSLITSLFEYSSPFGPGVTQIMVWFLLGQYLRHSGEECDKH